MTGTESPSTFGRAFAGFVGVSTVSVVILAGLGYVSAARFLDAIGIRSMWAGCAVAWFAGCIGAWPLATAAAGRSMNAANAILGSTALRFMVVLVLVVPLTLSGWFDRVTLVFSVAISYLVLLLVDTLWAVRLLKRISGK